MFHAPFFKLEKISTRGWQEWVVGVGGNIALVVLSGLMGALLFPPYELWWVAWIALCPLLIALRRTRGCAASGWLMLLFGLVFFASALPWIRQIFSGGMLGVYLLMTLPLVPFGIIYRALADRQPPWATIILMALLWVALDWVRCEGWYFQFSWGQLGFAFIACRKGGVLFPYLGVYGVTWLLVLCNAAVAEIVLMRQRGRARLLLLIACAAPVVALSLYLNLPPHAPAHDAGAFRVAMVQSEMGDLTALIRATRALQPEHPRLIVWPEYALVDYPLSQPDELRKLSQLAREMNATLILGCKQHLPATTPCDWLRRRGMMSEEGELFANTALIIGPQGNVLGTYQKTHPIQLFADGVPGTRFPSFATPVARLGIAICYDIDYAATARRLALHGAEVLVVPTFDAGNWSAQQHWQHARIAQARAAEVARWVVRPTSSGVSQIITPRGSNAVTITNGQLVTAIGEVTPSTDTTFYVRYTHYLPQVALIVVLFWVMALIIGQRGGKRRLNCDSLD
jgi:apolipoprotein N-acyltransferase